MRQFRKLIWAAVLASSALAAQTASIELTGNLFVVPGFTPADEPAAGWFSVFTIRTDAPDAPPMLGTYTMAGNNLTFKPRFPLAPGLTYLAEATLPDMRVLRSRITVPAVALPSLTSVEHIYPSADELPANILKLYIHFSAPMSKGEAWQHLHLLDADGKPVPLAFLEIDQELWDAAGQRLTVLFDPGRIKRGLVPVNELGSPVTEGRAYRLVIDKDWHDARGASLTSAFEKRFRGTPSVRDIPATKRWTITPPAANTTQPLQIRFPVPMDSALLARMIRIASVEGAGTIADNEREWHFTPTQPWKAGTYNIIADNLLEDISGNHLDRPFDVDLAASPGRSAVSAANSTIAFTVR